MQDKGVRELTALKSYLEYREGKHTRQRYSIANVQAGRCEFCFQIQAEGRYKWHLNTDFSIEVSDVSCFGAEEIPVIVNNSWDMREIIAEFDAIEPGRITISCRVKALTPEDSLIAIKREYSNRLAHIEWLLQSERDLKSECQWLKGEIEGLREHESQSMEERMAVQQELLCREGECQQLRDKENLYLNELNTMRNSRSWRLGQSVARVVRFFVPHGSKRASIAKIALTSLRHPIWTLRTLSPAKVKKLLRLLKQGDFARIKTAISRKAESMAQSPTFSVRKPDITKIDLVAAKKKTEGDYAVLDVPQWDEPLVSIIIPVYNQFDYTYHCVQSIIRNSGDVRYEIIIADDCSTDLTTKLSQIMPGARHIANAENLRFLLNCNNAAKHARGRYLLFLNNDTQVMANWLKPLVTLIESAPDIGMVGSKLIYPDGTLQEAGGIVWRDASAWNYGHRRNPEMPEFNYVKEVDYISGAAIMIRADLWNRLGGFDERFAPAYCEDSDLAFAVRDAGYRVMYQPQSVVVHFEGVSNGTDTSSGQKRYQIENTQKLREKWKDELDTHPENGVDVFAARDRSYNKKMVLFVDHYVPMFDKDAGSRTVFQYIRLFVQRGYNVKFIGDNFFKHEPYTSALQQMGVEVLYGPDCAKNWRKWISRNAEHIQFAFLNRPHIAPPYMEALRQYTKARIVYYGHDLAFLREMREYEVTGDKDHLTASKEWRSRELELMCQADMAYYPSAVEVEEIHKIDPTIRVKAIPAYIFENVNWMGYAFEERRDIMFIGGFTHRPNVDAVKWLAVEIMPKLVELLPDIKVHILGSNVPEEVRSLASENLIIEGFVTDEQLERFYHSCRIALVPLRYGAGIKGKVVEALRYGTPVVTTSIGAEGIIGAQDAMVVEDDAKAMAEKLAALYSDAKRLEAMSRRCVEYVRMHFSADNAAQVIAPEFDMNP